MVNLVCTGPGPHQPANGVLGTAEKAVPVLCPPCAQKAADASYVAGAAQRTADANRVTLTAQATAAIAANETWINNTAPLVQTAMDAIQAKTWPTRAATAPTFATLAAVTTHFGNVYDLILAPLVQQNIDLSQSVETLNAELVRTKQQLDATMRLVAGALDSTSGT